MIFFNVSGLVYKANEKYIVLEVKGYDRDKLNKMINRQDKPLYFFRMNIENVKIKDELILKYIDSEKSLIGMNITCSGIAKKYRYMNLNKDVVEGMNIIVKTITSAPNY